MVKQTTSRVLASGGCHQNVNPRIVYFSRETEYITFQHMDKNVKFFQILLKQKVGRNNIYKLRDHSQMLFAHSTHPHFAKVPPQPNNNPEHYHANFWEGYYTLSILSKANYCKMVVLWVLFKATRTTTNENEIHWKYGAAQKPKTVRNDFGKTLALKRLLGFERHCSETLFHGGTYIVQAHT